VNGNRSYKRSSSLQKKHKQNANSDSRNKERIAYNKVQYYSGNGDNDSDDDSVFGSFNPNLNTKDNKSN
jgi:hypothetical protein